MLTRFIPQEIANNIKFLSSAFERVGILRNVTHIFPGLDTIFREQPRVVRLFVKTYINPVGLGVSGSMQRCRPFHAEMPLWA